MESSASTAGRMVVGLVLVGGGSRGVGNALGGLRGVSHKAAMSAMVARASSTAAGVMMGVGAVRFQGTGGGRTAALLSRRPSLGTSGAGSAATSPPSTLYTKAGGVKERAADEDAAMNTERRRLLSEALRVRGLLDVDGDDAPRGNDPMDALLDDWTR